MYALSKTPISLETVQTLIAAHFGGQAKIERYTELTDGMYNAVYRIELADGQRSVLKVTQLRDLRFPHIKKLEDFGAEHTSYPTQEVHTCSTF